MTSNPQLTPPPMEPYSAGNGVAVSGSSRKQKKLIIVLLVAIIVCFAVIAVLLSGMLNNGRVEQNAGSIGERSSSEDNGSALSSEVATVEETPEHDAIKSVDLANSLIPFSTIAVEGKGSAECANFTNLHPTTLNLETMPDVADSCWYEMRDAKTVVLYQGMGAQALVPGMPMAEFDSENTIYRDIDADGYLDAIIPGRAGGAVGEFVYVFNPRDPKHPDAMGFMLGFEGYITVVFPGDGSGAIGNCRAESCSIQYLPPLESVENSFRIIRDDKGRARISDFQSH